MIYLKDLLPEDIQFKSGHDTDHVSGAKSVFVFNPNDTYEREGMTHGLESHAIKHLVEFDPQLFARVVSEVNKIIAQSRNKKLLGITDPRNISRFKYPYPKGTIINTLDMVNDKVVLGKDLYPEEKEIYVHITKLTNRYQSILTEIIDRAVDLPPVKNIDDETEVEKIREDLKNTGKVIKFIAEARGVEIFIVADFKTATIILLNTDGTVLSAYRPYSHKKNLDSFERLRKYFSNNSVHVTNPLIQKIFGFTK